MTVDIEDVFLASSQPAWLQTLIDLAVELGLTATSFRPGDIARTILEIMSFANQRHDATVSLIAQGGFLDFAATGTVSFENADGTTVIVPVSPDPSDPEQNPTGAITWLDALCEQNYNTTRIQFTFAGGELAIVNTSASTYGPYDAGGYHVSNPNNRATYTNVASLTIPPSTIAGTAVIATATSAGLIRITTSTVHGLTTGDAVFIAGILGTTEANGGWYVTVLTTTTFTLDGSTFSNAWTSGGIVYEPTVATVTADVGGSVSNSLDADGVIAVHTVTTSVTSLIGVSVDNLEPFAGSDIESNTELRDRARLKLQSLSVNGPRGAYEFFALSAVTYAPLLNPARAMGTSITRARSVVDLATGDVNTFLANSTGAPSSDDVDTVNLVLQANAVPLGITANTIGATEVGIEVEARVYLPAGYDTTANRVLFQTALQDYFEVLKIGGLSDPGGDYTNVVPIADVKGVLFEVGQAWGIPIQNATLTLDGALADVPLALTTSTAEVAKLNPATPTINFSPT